MHGNFPLLFLKVLHAELCSDLAYNCNKQSSCVLVGQMALLCGITLRKVLLCNHDNFVSYRALL